MEQRYLELFQAAGTPTNNYDLPVTSLASLLKAQIWLCSRQNTANADEAFKVG